MNIDERIEALVQSVELLALNSRDSDKRMDELRVSVAELVSTSDRLWKLYISQDRNLTMQERRLDDHDDRLHNL